MKSKRTKSWKEAITNNFFTLVRKLWNLGTDVSIDYWKQNFTLNHPEKNHDLRQNTKFHIKAAEINWACWTSHPPNHYPLTQDRLCDQWRLHDVSFHLTNQSLRTEISCFPNHFLVGYYSKQLRILTVPRQEQSLEYYKQKCYINSNYL